MSAKKPSKQQILSQLQNVKGIGPSLASRIYDAFKTKSLQMLVDDPDTVVNKVNGVSKRLAKEAGKVASERPDATLADMTDDLENCFYLPRSQVQPAIEEVWEDLNQQRRHVEAVREKVEKKLMNWPGVTGLHVGLREKRGQVVQPLQYCIRVHVEKKKGAKSVKNPLPKVIDGVRIDVVEMNHRSMSNGDPKSDYFPILMGAAPIANQDTGGIIGTLGGVFLAGTSVRYLTNHHVVFVEGGADDVVQPPDGSTPGGVDEVIGQVHDHERDGKLDAAVISRIPGRRFRFAIKGLPKTTRFEVNRLMSKDENKTNAIKFGAFTGKSEGIVRNVNATVTVKQNTSDAGVTMNKQILVESQNGNQIIESGDSGSLLLVKSGTASTYFVVGLVHAATLDFKTMIASHFEDVSDRFGIDV